MDMPCNSIQCQHVPRIHLFRYLDILYTYALLLFTTLSLTSKPSITIIITLKPFMTIYKAPSLIWAVSDQLFLLQPLLQFIRKCH